MDVIYTRIENAIVARLKLGLGKMARAVGSYGGELDEDIADAIGVFPAAWVTFAGITDTKPHSTSRRKYLCTGKFAVMVGEKNRRSEAAGRKGGPLNSEIGTYPLLYAVRRLLSGQDLGIEIDHLRPGRVRTLFNTRLGNQAFSVFAAEFETRWLEAALDNTRWPAPVDATDVDDLFARHQGKLDQPDPDLERVVLNTHLTPPMPADPTTSDVVELNQE